MSKSTFLLVITVLIAMVVILTGCMDSVDNSENEVVSDAKARMERLRYKLDDPAFWNSADRTARLIARTIDAEGAYSVSFRLSYPDGLETTLEDFYAEDLPCTNGEVIPSRIAYDLAVSDVVNEAHQNGRIIEITGVILKWAEAQEEEQKVFSVCDFTGDGAWDYVTDTVLVFSDTGAVPVKTADGKAISIDEVELKRAKLIELDQGVQLEELSEIALAD